MKKHFILLKTHKDTQLKYLCYHYGTEETCYTYLGSGRYWKYHIRKHGKNINTQILYCCETQEEARECGLKYSHKYNIVISKDYANLIAEDARTNFKHLEKLDRKRCIDNRQERREKFGLTSEEINNHERLGNLSFVMTDQRKEHYKKRADRLNNRQFTDAEIESFKLKSKKQKGVSMAERIGIETYSSPNKGKKFSDIVGYDYQHPDQIKYEIFINNISSGIFCVTEMLSKLRLSHSTIKTLRYKTTYVVKRRSDTKHNFSEGDILTAVKL